MSETIGSSTTVTAPTLFGVWVFDPLDPDGTERHYLFADGRTEDIRPDVASIPLAGQVNPLLEFGEGEVVQIALTIFVPFGVSDEGFTHDELVQWWRDACANRRTINYRDNRGRLYWVGLPAGVKPADGRVGTAFALTLQRVNYDESVG